MNQKIHRHNLTFWTKCLLPAIVAGLTAACGQSPQSDSLAVVDGKPISVEAFQQRYAKLLKMTSMRDNLLARQKVLQGLIAEEVTLAYADQIGLNADQEYAENADAIAQQTLLNAYAQRVAAERVKVSEQDVRKAFMRLKTQVQARHLYAPSLQEAQALYQRLQNGETFDQLAAEVFADPRLAANGGDIGTFTLGDMDPAFENAAFELKVGEFSQPVKTAYGYSIIQVIDRIRDPFVTEHDFQLKKHKIRSYVEWRMIQDEMRAYTLELAVEGKPQFNDKAVAYVWHLLESRGDSLRSNNSELALVLDGTNTKSERLIEYAGKSWSIKDFFEKAQLTSDRQKRLVQNERKLKEFILGLAIREHVLDQASQLGLQNEPEVIAEQEREKRGYLLKRTKSHIDQEVRAMVAIPEDSIFAHYQKFSDQYYFPEEANVAEILVESEQDGRALLKRIRKGEDFFSLAKAHSLREWAKPRGGELGMAPRGKFGALADTIFATRTGSVIGPLPVASYFSLIKVLEKKDRVPQNFEQAKEHVKRDLFWKWHRQELQKYMQRLREKFDIESNEQKLRKVAVSSTAS